jgi:hypothetical protein
MPAVNAVAPTGAVAQEMSDEWWFVQDLNGAIGLVKGRPPANVLAAIPIATAANFQELGNNHAQALANAQAKLAKLSGVSESQIQVLVTQLDQGAGAHYTTTNSGTYEGLTSLFVGSDADKNAVSSNVGTNLIGDAQQSAPDVSATSALGAISGIWNWLTTASNWVRILEYVGGAVLIYMGLKGLTGISAGPGGAM